MAFSDEIDCYYVSKLELCDFRSSNHILPTEYRLAQSTRDRMREQFGLQQYFRNWQIASERKMTGWRDDGVVYLEHDTDGLVGGVYLADRNEFDVPDWGQVHYAWILATHRGKGLYTAMFETVITRARSWGLKGVFLNSDREELPAVYISWGAKPWKQVKKARKTLRRRLFIHIQSVAERRLQKILYPSRPK